MGYISSNIAKKLIIDRFITGLQLIITNSNNLFFCEVYIYAKSTKSPYQKYMKKNKLKTLVIKYIVTYRIL